MSSIAVIPRGGNKVSCFNFKVWVIITGIDTYNLMYSYILNRKVPKGDLEGRKGSSAYIKNKCAHCV